MHTVVGPHGLNKTRKAYTRFATLWDPRQVGDMHGPLKDMAHRLVQNRMPYTYRYPQ